MSWYENVMVENYLLNIILSSNTDNVSLLRSRRSSTRCLRVSKFLPPEQIMARVEEIEHSASAKSQLAIIGYLICLGRPRARDVSLQVHSANVTLSSL